MRILPAIDIKDGQCVRLRQGNVEEQTIYGDPVLIAQRFIDEGASWIHVVDLDGALTGRSINIEVIERIASKSNIKIQLGGGIRSMQAVDAWMAAGVRRIVLGTAALENQRLLKTAVEKFTGRVAVGIDSRNGKVVTHGWKESTNTTPLELARQVCEMGVNTIIYTDVSKDGMLEGPNIEATRILCEQSGMEIVGSGGVHRLEDITAFREIGCSGVIIGKAIYDEQFSLSQAIEQARI